MEPIVHQRPLHRHRRPGAKVLYTLRLSPETVEALAARAATRQTTSAALARALIENGLRDDTEPDDLRARVDTLAARLQGLSKAVEEIERAFRLVLERP